MGSCAHKFKMGRTSILLISTGLVLVLSSYSEAYSGDRFTKVGTLGRLHYVGTKLSWQNANKHCKSLGSRLVEIYTDRQYKELNNWLNHPTPYWIGLSDKTKNQHWVWESGRLLDGHVAKHWAKGQPNGKGTTNCVCIFPPGHKWQGMHDWLCDDRVKLNFVCQKPYPRNGGTGYTDGGICKQAMAASSKAMAVAVKACSMERSARFCRRGQRPKSWWHFG